MKNKENVIVVDKEYDRFIFLFYKDNNVVGINFHQGIDELLIGFNKPCPHITELFNRLSYNTSNTVEQNIHEAIELYTETFIFKTQCLHN
jgi:hypothetical protein